MQSLALAIRGQVVTAPRVGKVTACRGLASSGGRGGRLGRRVGVEMDAPSSDPLVIDS